MQRDVAGQKVGAQMVSAADGSAFTGAVTVYITGDAGIQAIGAVGAGLCVHEGNGYHTYAPAQAETNYELVACSFIGAGAIPQTLQVYTWSPAQTVYGFSVSGTAGVASTPSTTVLKLVSQALRRIGVLGEAQVATAQQAADGMDMLNDYVADILTNDRLAIFAITRTVFTIVSGTATYTVGIGGTVNVARPVTMNMQGSSMAFIDTAVSPTNEIPLWPLTDDAYQAIPQKALASTYPNSYYYNPTYTYASPYGSLTVFPVPNISTLQGVLYAPAAVQEFTALTQVIALPPGYRRFLRDNLAIELASDYTVTPSESLMNSAREAKASVLASNTRLVELSVDLALTASRGSSNIYLGS